MRFERLHLLVTYLLVGTGFLVLLLSQEMPPLFWITAIPALVLSWPLGGHPGLSSVKLWNSILIVALVVLGISAGVTGAWLHHALYFTTLMVVAKLFQRQNSKDIFQLYALSFLQLVGGAVINPTLSFAICFVLYVVFLTWALVMLHLRRDLENLAQLSPDEESNEAASERVRRLIGPGFLAGTSVLALLIFSSSIIVFLLFPRLGLGFFGHNQQRGTSVSGFSDTIELGHFGKLKQDQTIIMRVDLPETDTQKALPLRLKGISFDQYNGMSWTKSNTRYMELNSQYDNYWIVPDTDHIPDNSTKIVQRIYLEQLNMGLRTVFGEPRMKGVRDQVNSRYIANPRKHTLFFRDTEFDVIYSKRTSGPLRYEAVSYRVKWIPMALRQIDGFYPRYSERYTQLPPLNPAVGALARQITQGKTNSYDKVAAIERYLLKEYNYSLEGGHDPEDPLGDFLFKRKSGHCEYFSTALVVLARSLGIAARPVGGFYGGIHNEMGDFIAIRQADAHSWAEIYFPGHGWVTFDSTPASDVLVAANNGIWATMGRYFDSMELLWYKWVIRWDLERQLDFFKEIGRKIPGLDGLFSQSRSHRRKVFKKVLDNVLIGVISFVVFMLLMFALRVWWRRRKAANRGRALQVRNDRDAKAARKIYNRLLKLMKKRGMNVGPSTTPERITVTLTAHNPELANIAVPLLSCYQDVVFGRKALSPHQLSECKVSYKALAATL
ncbi:MAG TPA: DUF3488 domain-containing protein [Myxococcales bacterium]|nr:DUF3488 domain-containing protein [Myxococcales bacterium]